jgi:hypothetical protein
MEYIPQTLFEKLSYLGAKKFKIELLSEPVVDFVGDNGKRITVNCSEEHNIGRGLVGKLDVDDLVNDLFHNEKWDTLENLKREIAMAVPYGDSNETLIDVIYERL